MTAQAVGYAADAPPAGVQAVGGPSMAGCVVLITAERRADQLESLFQRRGARVRHAPVLTLVPHSDDPLLVAATRSLIERPPDIVVVTTAVGFRGWIEAADSEGLASALLKVLDRTRIIARGPKALGAIQSAGLAAAWSAPTETAAEMTEHLLADDVAGLRIAVQHHACGSDGLDHALRAAGAEVVDLIMYRQGPPRDPLAVEAAVQEAAGGQLDAICFTSAMAVLAWQSAVDDAGLWGGIIRRIASGELAVAAVGPVCAAPLRARGIEPLVPERSRLGALVRVVDDHYRHQPALSTSAGALQLRATTAVLDGRVIQLTPGALDLLRLLAGRGGAVVSRAEVVRALPGNGNGEHAAEVAVSRLREACGSPGLIRTVVKRGYRLDVVS